MAGGRPPKSIKLHELEGTYREDRHGARARSPQAPGMPIKPTRLKGDAAEMWEQITPTLVGLKAVGTIDTAMLISACDFWELYCKARRKASRSAHDKEVRCNVIAYHQEFLACVTKLGLSPTDRNRWKSDAPPDVQKPLMPGVPSRNRSG